MGIFIHSIPASYSIVHYIHLRSSPPTHPLSPTDHNHYLYHPYLLPASFLLFLPLAKLSSNASFWLCAAVTSCFKLCLPGAIALTGLCTTCSPACRSSSLCL